jgi:hypothetical protein
MAWVIHWLIELFFQSGVRRCARRFLSLSYRFSILLRYGVPLKTPVMTSNMIAPIAMSKKPRAVKLGAIGKNARTLPWIRMARLKSRMPMALARPDETEVRSTIHVFGKNSEGNKAAPPQSPQ